MKIYVILGSTRQNRQSETVGKWAMSKLPKLTDVEFELVDLRDWPLPFFDEKAGPAYLNGEYSHSEGKKWAEKVAQADGYIIIAQEYNRGYPAVLKNALDYAYNEWNRKPISFVSYGGGVGGSRSVEQLRQVAVELQMVPTRFGVHITDIWAAFNKEGRLNEEEKYTHQLQSLVDDHLWWAKILKTGRESVSKYNFSHQKTLGRE